MKIVKTLLIAILLFSGYLESRGQIVSDRSNQLRLDFTLDSLTKTILPEIEWVYPSMDYTNSTENKIKIESKITSLTPLKSVKLNLKKSENSDPFATRQEYVEYGALSVEIEKSLYLQDGQNIVELEVEDINGGIVKDFRSIIVGMDAISTAIAIDRKDYAILFATDKYDNWSDLVNPIFDSNTIAKELEDRFGFEVKVVENADQDKVFTTLREYAKMNYKPQDQLFIFFAGHGQYDDTFGEGYVVAKNSLAKDPGKVTYISHNRLRNNIDNIKCDHIFLAMDVCFGGTFDPILASSRALYDEIDNAEFIVKKLSVKTRKYVTSGGKEYVSDGIKGQHSPFARKFLEALRDNGGDDRILTLAELNIYLQKLQTTPRAGAFGSDEQGSEFLFIAK